VEGDQSCGDLVAIPVPSWSADHSGFPGHNPERPGGGHPASLDTHGRLCGTLSRSRHLAVYRREDQEGDPDAVAETGTRRPARQRPDTTGIQSTPGDANHPQLNDKEREGALYVVAPPRRSPPTKRRPSI
jgi:hypothetical protein